MTTKAREVLADCKVALQELRTEGLQGHAWRLRWITTVVLLRAVGNVLAKVDSVSSVGMKGAIKEAWDECKGERPPIFVNFIKEDRNLILKEYSIRTGQGVTVEVGGPTKWSYRIKGGHFDGRDQREVVEKAIAWWEDYLDDVDARAARLSDSSLSGLHPSHGE